MNSWAKARFLTMAFVACAGSLAGVMALAAGVPRAVAPAAAASDLLAALPSPILLHGDEHRAFRDPLLAHVDGKFWLFYSLATNPPGPIRQGKAHWVVAYSTSTDLRTWTAPVAITPADRALNYSSPGSLIRQNGEWVLSLQTYPTPHGEKFGNGDSRLWLMRSADLRHWAKPELIRFLGPEVPREKMPRMIDPFVMPDKDRPGRWLAFGKIRQTGVSMAWSGDLKTWHYTGRVDGGENVGVVVQGNEYVMYHSPPNGIGEKRSEDGVHWREVAHHVLGQADWPWARERLTAGYVLDARDVPGVGRYLMVFHGEPDADSFSIRASIGIAWSDDLKTWNWPGKAQPLQLILGATTPSK